MPNKPNEKLQTRNDELRRRAKFDDNLQADPELAAGPAGGGRIALFAIAIIAIIGVVFYGLNNPSITPQPESTAQTTTTTAPPSTTATAPTPAPGQTTGSAMTPAQPANPPAASSNSSPSDSNTTTPQINAAPSPSNGGTTPSGAPANN